MILGAMMRKICGIQRVRDPEVFSVVCLEEEGDERKMKDIEKLRWKDVLRSASLVNCRGSRGSVTWP